MEPPAEYKIERANAPEQPEGDGPETFSPAQIEEQQAALEQAQNDLETSKQQAKDAKARYQMMVANVNLSSKDLPAWIFQMYWHSPAWAKTLRKLVKERYGDAHQTWKQIVAAKVVTKCRTCGEDFENVFTSKSDYEALKKGYRHQLTECSTCTQERVQKEYQQRRQMDAEQRKRIDALQVMPYDEYLQTDHWKAVRKSMLKRGRYKCQICGSNGQLHVHHKTYDHLGHEGAQDLLVVCADCHAKIHNKEPAQ